MKKEAPVYTIKEDLDTCGDTGFTNIFNSYNSMDVETFKEYCIKKIRESRSPDPKKMLWTKIVTELNNKDKILKKMTDFMLAGEGLRV